MAERLRRPSKTRSSPPWGMAYRFRLLHARHVRYRRAHICQWLSVVTNERTVRQDGSPILPKALGQLQRFAASVEQSAADCESRCAQAIVDAVGVVGKSGVPQWRPGLAFLKHS